jgi:hypothetical protein
MNKFVLILIVSSNIVFGSIASATDETCSRFSRLGCILSNDTNSCWIASGPLKVENTKNGKPAKNVTRGEIILFCSYLPKKGVLGEVSFAGGYTFVPGQMIDLQIGSTKYALIPDGNFAWATNSDIDTKIRISMTRGSDSNY